MYKTRMCKNFVIHKSVDVHVSIPVTESLEREGLTEYIVKSIEDNLEENIMKSFNEKYVDDVSIEDSSVSSFGIVEGDPDDV